MADDLSADREAALAEQFAEMDIVAWANAIKAGEQWADRQYWPWCDAVSWLATGCEPLVKYLATLRCAVTEGVLAPNGDLTADEQRASDKAGHHGKRLGASGWHEPSRWLIPPGGALLAEVTCLEAASRYVADRAAIDSALAKLREELASGKVTALGRDPGGVQGLIPAHAWERSVPRRDSNGLIILEGENEQPIFSHLLVRMHRVETTSRSVTRNYDATDAPLLNKMRDYISTSGASVTIAASMFQEEARGGGTPSSRAKRLERKYKERFPDN